MAAPTRRVRVLPSAQILLVHIEERSTEGRRIEHGGQADGLPIHPDLGRARHGIHGCGHMLPLIEGDHTRGRAERGAGHGGAGGRPGGQLNPAILEERHGEPFAHEGIAPGKKPGFGPEGDLRLDPGIQGGVGAEAIEHRRIRDTHIVIHPVEDKGLLADTGSEGGAQLHGARLAAHRIGCTAIPWPGGEQLGETSGRGCRLGQGLQAIQRIIAVAGHLDRIGQTQPVPGGVIAVG